MYSDRESGRKKFFYGWIVVICGALVLGVTHGVVSNCFSLYIIPVSEALGISRDAFSICSMIINGLYAAVSLLSGRIYRRFQLRTLLHIAAVTLPVSYFCYSFCTSAAQLYLVSAAVGLSVSFISFVPFTIIIGNWFEEKRGTALGLCFMGSGLGGMVMNSMTALLLENFGWQRTYQVTAAVMLAVLLVLVFLVIRVTPEEKNLRPLGVSGEERAAVHGPTAGEAVRTGSFRALAALALVIGLNSSVLSVVIAPHLCDLGYSTLYAAGVTSAYLGCLAVSKILLGRLYDRLGAIRGTALSLTGFLLGLLGLFLSRQSWAVPLIMFSALGTASSNVSYPVTTLYAFGNRDYATLYGYMMGINFIVCSIGPLIANRIFTVTGSYDGMLLACMAAAAVGMVCLAFVRPEKNPKEKKAVRG